ncbi:MAG: phosphate acyltransferase [Sulfuricurvum sp. GWF2_44_89]|jgi:glycerol-3-phosphate acyltransferase PlsX|uniref:Phosphate acyltransferase n=1 Tax=Sulfuricurvum kujiense TaxID=148813 RepID=A0A2D3WF70_9BACT|nr:MULTISPECIES: phosphate acyltransferase PlsX [Sulfuricurvum]OHD77075.1 MAG: phosphate acyltransferase [Sulfuricurvum sp. GWF2_44_89]OHD90479.1 MAG: phosphate acyltransferase [Sulfuricurvum sp. RIFOXYD12_FULL_44_77]OHD92451.1 MAG: phosphate acyltransferase [Sulfuricurvum sp. RIFOXYD2_FULL_44_160]DAB37387.1 MAG TPA: phosphate acyltransferase [Sulfuricurvum kujiense]
MIRIAIDAMGGDFGPEPIVKGTLEALKEVKFQPILVGKKDEILSLLPKGYKDKILIVEASDVIDMGDAATDALKRQESSIYKAIELVRNGEADGVVSAGHSGATMTLATLRLGRLKNVLRPALVTSMPTKSGKRSILMDAGANVDCKAEHLFQFGIMGYYYAQDMFKLENPRVGLLANGEEDSKGNEVTKETFKLLEGQKGFIGNVEGNNIFDGSCDVIVCDGFIGNLVLKASEGVASTISYFIKEYIRKSPVAITGALLMRKVFKLLKKQIDYAEIGGAPLVGIKGCAIVSHGKSNPKAIKNAIFQAIRYVNTGVNEHIENRLEELKK